LNTNIIWINFFLFFIIAVVVRGRNAGKKVVIVKQFDEGTKANPFPHAIVAGVERAPLKVTKSMGAKKLAKKTKVKPFVKLVNYNHLMPTRYSFDVEPFKAAVTVESLSEPSQREDAKKTVKKVFEERHQSGKNKWFFTKLAF
jgi:large subunit ribosomal protein L27e